MAIKVQVLLGRYRSWSQVHMWSAGAVSLTKLLTFSLLHFRSGLRQPVNYHLRLKLWGMTSCGAGKSPVCVCVCIVLVSCGSRWILILSWYHSECKTIFYREDKLCCLPILLHIYFWATTLKSCSNEYYANKRKQYKVHWTFLMIEYTQQSEPLTSTISGRCRVCR